MLRYTIHEYFPAIFFPFVTIEIFNPQKYILYMSDRLAGL